MPPAAASGRHAGAGGQQPAQQGHSEPAARAVHADEEVGPGPCRAGVTKRAGHKEWWASHAHMPAAWLPPPTTHPARMWRPRRHAPCLAAPPPAAPCVPPCLQHRAPQRRVLPVRHRGLHALARPAGARCRGKPQQRVGGRPRARAPARPKGRLGNHSLGRLAQAGTFLGGGGEDKVLVCQRSCRPCGLI